jgi:hypothetical protein
MLAAFGPNDAADPREPNFASAKLCQPAAGGLRQAVGAPDFSPGAFSDAA